VAKMFVNNANGQRGLVCQYDVVCFNEVAGISFDQKDGVNIMKGYMASGQFSRGKENIRAEGSIVMVGNLDVDVEQQQRVGHLLSPMPPEMRDDTAFMDRIHAYAPGWDYPKLKPSEHLTDHFGLVSDFLSECWSRLRIGNRMLVMQGRVHLGGALNLGGSIEMIPNAVRIAELAIDKQAQTLLMPVSARRQLNDLPDDLWTKLSIEFYKDGADAVFKSLVE
jgi:ATP-dependent Lon protease